MAKDFRLTAIATIAIVGLSAFAAIAGPPVGGDPTAIPSAKTEPSKGYERPQGVEQRIADLHASLKITPAQQPPWDQFAAVMRDNARDMDSNFKARIKAMPSMTAPENMQSYAQLAANHAQDVQKLVSVFQALYDTMSDSQKQTADEIFRDDAHHHHHGRPHGPETNG
jgi:LTXXQ motif family protein